MKTKVSIKEPQNLAWKAKLLELSGDESRIRILCALYARRTLCVSDLSKLLGCSLARVSHHLQVMEEHGLLEGKREGKRIIYSVSRNPLMNIVKELICYKERKYAKQS